MSPLHRHARTAIVRCVLVSKELVKSTRRWKNREESATRWQRSAFMAIFAWPSFALVTQEALILRPMVQWLPSIDQSIGEDLPSASRFCSRSIDDLAWVADVACSVRCSCCVNKAISRSSSVNRNKNSNSSGESAELSLSRTSCFSRDVWASHCTRDRDLLDSTSSIVLSRGLNVPSYDEWQ